MNANRNNHRFIKFGFSIEDLETFQADVVSKYNPDEQEEYDAFVKNIWDAAQQRLIVGTGSRPVHRQSGIGVRRG